MINKSVEALLRGYIFFDVNGEIFWLYNSASERRKSIKSGRLLFKGFSIFKGWRGFYERMWFSALMGLTSCAADVHCVWADPVRNCGII